jgi:hypothetical protein
MASVGQRRLATQAAGLLDVLQLRRKDIFERRSPFAPLAERSIAKRLEHPSFTGHERLRSSDG